MEIALVYLAIQIRLRSVKAIFRSQMGLFVNLVIVIAQHVRYMKITSTVPHAVIQLKGLKMAFVKSVQILIISINQLTM